MKLGIGNNLTQFSASYQTFLCGTVQANTSAVNHQNIAFFITKTTFHFVKIPPNLLYNIIITNYWLEVKRFC